MFVLRPVRPDDLDALLRLAGKAGFGLTTLLPERAYLEKRILLSMRAFDETIDEPTGQPFLFVLEDTTTGKIVGTSGIVSKIGGFEPFYCYRIVEERFESESLGVARDIKALHLVAEHSGPAEIGSLFLDPDCQRRGLGGLIARARYLFVAERPALFEPTIVAELRGVIDDEGHSPFWDAVGAHFFGVDFPRADYMSVKNKQFIAELMPRHPLYLPLLPASAQAVVGREHEKTRPARRMLEAEGFTFSGLVDIFEAGPVLACARDDIRTVRDSRRATMVEIVPRSDKSAPHALIGNVRLDFRACLAPVEEIAPGKVRLAQETAAALEINPGDPVRYFVKPR